MNKAMFNEAIQFRGDHVLDAPLYVWLGAGGDWQYLGETKGLRIADKVALPGDWVIKSGKGFVIAREI